MNTTLKSPSPDLASSSDLALSVRQAYDGPASGLPKPEWVRDVCPDCGGDVIANCYYVGSLGFMVIWECWLSLLDRDLCDYRRIL